MQSQTSAGAQLETSGTTSFTYTTSAGDLDVTIASAGSDVVGAYTDITISMTASNPVEQNGYFMFNMLKWNSGTQTLGLETSMLTY